MEVVFIVVASKEVYPWGDFRYGMELIFNSNNVKATVAIATGGTGIVAIAVLMLIIALFMCVTTVHVAGHFRLHINMVKVP